MLQTDTIISSEFLVPEVSQITERIIAVIPAFNEERFIASVVFKARRFASHVIVVDDGSSDHTAEWAAAAGAEVVIQPRNQGKAEALNAGFIAARKHDPQVVVCLDADAQHDAAEIPHIVKPILQGDADVVIGSRFLSTKSRIPAWRQIGQHTLTQVTNSLSRIKVTDSQSGFRAFSLTATEALRFSSQGLSVESEMQFLFSPAGLRVLEVPISVSYLDGNKRNPIVHGMQVLDSMMSLVARRRPLAFFALPGAIISAVGIALGIYVSWMMFTKDVLLPGSAILTSLLIIGGVLLSVTGIMLHSVGSLAARLKVDVTEAIATTLLKHSQSPN